MEARSRGNKQHLFKNLGVTYFIGRSIPSRCIPLTAASYRRVKCCSPSCSPRMQSSKTSTLPNVCESSS
eukprot:11376090-Prorocentrum_lima.AAC.1